MAHLIRHWTLDGADLAAVDRRRGAPNQVGTPCSFARSATPAGGRPGRSKLDDLRKAFGFRMYAPEPGREMLAWLLPVALATMDAWAITTALMDERRRRRMVAPGPSVAERHVAGQLTHRGALQPSSVLSIVDGNVTLRGETMEALNTAARH